MYLVRGQDESRWWVNDDGTEGQKVSALSAKNKKYVNGLCYNEDQGGIGWLSTQLRQGYLKW